MANRPAPRLRPPSPEEAEALGIQVLGRLAADDERLGRFLEETGLLPGEIRRAAAEPGFLVALLDHVLGDEALLVALAEELGRPPESFAAARQALAPERYEE